MDVGKSKLLCKKFFFIKDLSTCSVHLLLNHGLEDMTTASKKPRVLTKEQQINLASHLAEGNFAVSLKSNWQHAAKVVKLLASQPKRVRDVREKLDTKDACAAHMLGLSKRLCNHLKYLAT